MSDSSTTPARSPWRRILEIRREEWPQTAFMFGYFFLVITTFWILKPLKKALFVEFYETDPFELLTWSFDAAQAEQIAKVCIMFVALAAAAAFAALSGAFRRQRLTFVFSTFIIAALLAFSFWLQTPEAGGVWSFYFFGDLYSTLMVAAFFAFLNDAMSSGEAKRLYGLIGLGGVAGGAFGSTFLRLWIDDFSLAQWLWICVGIGVLIVGCAAGAGRIFDRRPRPVEAEKSVTEAADRPRANVWRAGRIVLSSRYLLAIVAIVGLYEMISTVMDFQFTSTVVHYLDGEAIGEHFSTVYAFTNIVALLVQLFLTSFVMTRFGVGAALLFLPVAALSGSTAFLAAPILLFGSLLNTADNGFSYSINQSAKEVLYTPVSAEDKYQAKAFIDMFVQRFAKALAVGLALVITSVFTDFSAIRWLSLLTIAIAGAWVLVCRYAGHEFRRRTSESAEQPPKHQPEAA